jgi:hypothetical protein
LPWKIAKMRKKKEQCRKCPEIWRKKDQRTLLRTIYAVPDVVSKIQTTDRV